MQTYTVKTSVFEGPLELLLNLIEKRRLLINDVSLAQVTDDFITYIETHNDFPTADTAQFILIASTLLLIKSKSLLPTLSLTEEEQTDIKDLEQRLAIYQCIRDVSREIKSKFGTSVLFPRQRILSQQDIYFTPGNDITQETLEGAIKMLLSRIPKKETLPKTVVEKVISLEEMITRLGEKMQQQMQLTFRDFSKSHHESDKKTVIVSFLAMLELVKRGIILVTQHRDFDDIHIESKEVQTPRY